MPAITYNYAAASCPAIVNPGALLNPGAANKDNVIATVAQQLVTGDHAWDVATKEGGNAVRLDNVGRYGGGGYAINEGLVPSNSSGLTISYTAGNAGIDSGIYVPAGTVTATAGITQYFWILSDGSISAPQSTTTPPTGARIFWLRAAANSTNVTELDQSGVFFRRKGGLFRRTGDNDAPTDTPPADHIIDTQTLSGTFRWNGTAYVPPSQFGRAAITMTDANYTLTAANFRKQILAMSGTLTAGRDVVLPNIDGLQFTLWNNTAQALTFKVTGQTGVAVAAGKRAILYCNGTDYVRVTADT